MYLIYHQKFEELERARWDSWTGTSSQRRGNRSSSHKADGRWVPPPGCQDSVANSLHYPQDANSPTASLSPDPFNIPTSLVLRGRGGIPSVKTLPSIQMRSRTSCLGNPAPSHFPMPTTGRFTTLPQNLWPAMGRSLED
ncbi:hypothetical protein E2320_001451 [Naja naja]|nr:hypothetical protein E2320_001451 [Naja naja]